MRKYLSKIIPITVVAIVFSVAFFIDAPRDVAKYTNSLLAQNKMAGDCYGGDGSTRYLNGNYNVRSSANSNSSANILDTYEKCTVVKVYCTSGDWSKVSKTSNMWIYTGGLSKSLPSGCDTTYKTTTKKITFKLGKADYTYAAGMDQMYSNKAGTIEFALTEVKNLADDDDDLIKVTVKKGSEDYTSSFTIRNTYSNGHGIVKLVQNNEWMPKGTYTVNVTIGGSSTATKDFSIKGKYYDFKIDDDKSGVTTNYWGTPSNFPNEWKIETTGVTDAWDQWKYTMKVFKVKSNGELEDATSKFTVYQSGEKTFYMANNFGWWTNRPTPGKYRLYLYYLDTNYSDARGTISDYYEFVLGARNITFERENMVSQRFVNTTTQTLYTIQIVSKTTTGGVKYVTFIENGTTKTLTEAEFAAMYSDADISGLTLDSTGHIIYKFSQDCTITNYTATNVTYIDANEAYKTVTREAFETLFPSAISYMEAMAYLSGASGYLNYTITGTKVVESKVLSPKNQILFAAVGGRITFTYKYDHLNDEDFTRAKVVIKKDDGTVVDEDDGFTFSWTHTSTHVTMYLTYDNDNEEKYKGDYTIYIDFDDTATQEVPFTLYDGEIDFYLTSQVDAHLETSEPLETQNPPGNQRFEYYVGFFLVKGGKIQTSKNAKMIDVKIYDHMADVDENGHIYYYDQVDYEVRIQKYLNNKVTYQVALNNGEFTTVTDEPLATFKSKYEDAAELIDKYNYDANGAIVSDNYELHITNFYEDASIGDMQVKYKDAAGKVNTMRLETFRIQYPDMYAYLVTRFVFDENGAIIPGALLGNYRVLEYNGEKIVGKEVTHDFDITIDKSAENIEKPITILPKTEVKKGRYYIYVTFDTLKGVGYVNNSEDPVITKELYPEMWEQNIHMTSIEYDDPVYSIDIEKPKLSNVGNTSAKIYNNIEGTAKFDLTYNYIYNYDGVSYGIEYYNGTSWVDAKDAFELESSIDKGVYENAYIELTSKVESIKTGKYRLIVNYENDGFNCTSNMEFEVSGKYYGLVIEEGTEISFIHNYAETKNILAKGYFISDANKIVPSIERVVSGGLNEKLVHDASTKTFKNSRDKVVFSYSYNIQEDYYQEEDTLLYEFLLTNVEDETDIGDYELTFTYQEGTDDVSKTKFEFEVGEDEYYYVINNERPLANDTGMYLYMDITTRHINYGDLDDFAYTIYWWDSVARRYVDVSSDYADTKMFDIINSWDQNSGPDFKGQLEISINEALVQMDGDYYIEASYKDTRKEFDISNLNDLFAWNIKKHTIGSVYTEEADGETVDIKLDKIYNNLKNGVIDIELESVYENDISWTINKSCIAGAEQGSCSPLGTNYNNRFNDGGNGSGKSKHLTLTLKDDLTDSEMLKPGEYSLVLYYSEDNFKYINFVVESEYAEIIIGDSRIYSDISADKVANGLYSNKTGYIHMPIKLRGIPYNINLLNIKVTNANGTASYTDNFIINSNSFADDHIIEFIYDKSTEMLAGDYLITLKYITVDGAVYGTLPFEIKEKYYNFDIGEPIYNPDPLYPNVEDGGIATFVVETEDIPNVIVDKYGIDENTEKHVLAKNTKVIDVDGNDVTEYFNITAENHDTSVETASFNLNVQYQENAVVPGDYTIETRYELYGYITMRTQEFEVGDYVKDLSITKTDIITTTNDGRIHNNVGGTYRVNYVSDFELQSSALKVKVYNEENIDVSSNFEITVFGEYVDVKYTPSDPVIDSGDYSIVFTYQEETVDEIFTTMTKVKMYGTYKDILLKNLTQSNDIMYADIDDQYFEFEVESAAMSTEDKNNLIFKIYDANEKLVYSDETKDNVTNQFSIENKLNTTDENVRVNIEPFKARVGDYTIKAFLPNDDGDYNFSNVLTLNIEYTYYKITLSNKSYIKPVVTYGNDKTSIYDIDGANVFYKFTSSYNAASNGEYTIKVYDGLELIKEFKPTFTTTDEDGLKYIITEFETGELPAGTYDFAICINGLPYTWKTQEIKEYVAVTNVTMVIDNKKITDGKATLYMGQIKNATFLFEPSHATNPYFEFTSADTGIAKFDNKNGKIEATGIGSTQIKLSNKDISVTAVLTIEERLTSETYQIDYDKYQIYVSEMTSKTLSKDAFLKNLIGVLPSYKIYDKNNVNVTSTVKNIGTGMTIENGNEKYTIVIIGDLTKDGKIDVYDVSMLYQYIRGKRAIKDTASLKAASIRKQSKVNVYDVTKLYQFVRGKIKKL